jgi:antitoxin component HigA of HigAB toxin-antitoxin module
MAKLRTKFEEFIADPKRRPVYERESLAFEAAELISGLMEQHQVNKTELAERIGASKSHVTQLLSGSRNMTTHTLADLAFALGHKG